MLLQAPTDTCASSGSHRLRIVKSTSSSRPTSSATTANTASGDTPPATSVATRRSAACSSAWLRSSTRACALAIAVPTSSVNPASRASVPAGSCSSQVDIALMSPHSRPSTLIGAPTDERMPRSRATSAT